MQAQMLQCPCGNGEQDAFHVWHECSHSHCAMEAACESIERAWPQAAQLPGWSGASVRDRVQRALSLGHWDDQQQLKCAMVKAVLDAMRKHNDFLQESNRGFKQQIRHRSIARNRQRTRTVAVAV